MDEEQFISSQIKNISLEDALDDFHELQTIGINAYNMSSRSRIGNNCVDYFTFTERLHTKGKYNASFFDFLSNIEKFKEKKFIKNMLVYYENVKNKNKTKNKYIVYKEVYNICISAINIFRPLVAMDLYTKYKPRCVLDFACGWGGRFIGACALNIPKYIGIDINTNLREPYEKMQKIMSEKSTTLGEFYFQDALTIDYSKIDYDLVLTSPPYYFLEKYSNNLNYESKREMDEKFYTPLFLTTFKYLKQGGVYCLNINKEIYNNVCIDLFGEANEIIPLKKSKRQNDYSEYIYVYKKS